MRNLKIVTIASLCLVATFIFSSVYAFGPIVDRTRRIDDSGFGRGPYQNWKKPADSVNIDEEATSINLQYLEITLELFNLLKESKASLEEELTQSYDFLDVLESKLKELKGGKDSRGMRRQLRRDIRTAKATIEQLNAELGNINEQLANLEGQSFIDEQVSYEIGPDTGAQTTIITKNQYKIVNGEAVLLFAETVSVTQYPFGEQSTSTSLTVYAYDAEGRLINETEQTQTFDCINGSETTTERTISYSYDAEGNLVSAVGVETFNQNVPNMRSSGSYDLRYEIIDGEAVLMQKVSRDPMVVQVFNVETGQYEVACTEEHNITYRYIILNGNREIASIRSQVTRTDEETDANGRHFYSSEDITTTYEYDSVGNLIGASGSGTGHGYLLGPNGTFEYTTTIEIAYIIIDNEAFMYTRTEKREYTTDPDPDPFHSVTFVTF